jgi:hypothetical protein
MSHAFVESFAKAHRAGQRAFNEGDFETAFAGLAPDVEWHALPRVPETGMVKGREAVVRYFHGIREGIDWQVEAQEFIEAGYGSVLVRQRGTAIGRTTGITDNLEWFQLWDVGSDGLTARVREFERREDALKAAGLSE